MRVTNRMMVNNLMYNLQKNVGRLDRSNQELATGKKYIIPQEDPIGAVISMKFRAKISEAQQFSRNIDDGIQWLETSDGALDQGVSLLQRAKQLAIYGANDTLVQQDRDAIALEVNELLNGMISVANTDFKGDYIFAGYETDEPPFETFNGEDSGQTEDILSPDWKGGILPDRSGINLGNVTEIRYNGNDGVIKRQVQSSIDVAINDPGSEIFMSNFHRIQGGSSAITDTFSVLNGASNFNGSLNPLNSEGAFALGLEGEDMTVISYDGNRHTLVDVVDEINRKVNGVQASYDKISDDAGNVEYKLVLESKEAGKKIQIEDSTLESVVRSKRSIGANTADAGGWYGLFGAGNTPEDGSGSTADQVFINGEQFVLADYADIESFMTAVELDSQAAIDDFSYNATEDVFSITAESGSSISMYHEGTNGFFAEGVSNINDSGNLMEKLGMMNMTKSSNGIAKDTRLENFNIVDGKIEINGTTIDIDSRIDTLDRVAWKINDMDLGVTARLQEHPVDASLPAAQRTYRLVLESDHPGEIKINDRDTGLFETLGIQDYNTLKMPGYGEHVDPYKSEVFDVLKDIRDHLYAGDTDKLSGQDLESLDNALNGMLQIRAKIGARINSMETTQTKVADVEFNTTSLLSKIEDVDLSETIMKLRMQESVYQSALSSGARVIQPTLMNYI